jgi:ABC-type antimicrobial peptide transport system permease subunit
VVYVPFTQREIKERYVYAVRASGSPEALIRAVRGEIGAISPNIQVLNVRTLARQMDERLADERLLALVSAVFGTLALVLAGIGIHGMVAYTIAQRTPELGLRLALGANRKDLLWLVLRGSLMVTAAGLVIGLAAAVAASGVITSLLFGVQTSDSRVYLAAIVFLGLVAIAAIVPPMLRAIRIQPMMALRID